MNTLQYKYYYNIEKRKARGLNILNNSNNYFLFGYDYYYLFPNRANRLSGNANYLNLGWGFKRFIGNSRWYYGGEIGIFVPIAGFERPIVAPRVNIKLGYMLYKKDFNIQK